MTWFVIVNPRAGGVKDPGDRVRAALDSLGIPAEVRRSASAEHVDAVVAEGTDAGFDRFCAVGGDGTVSLVADALLRRGEDPLLGILPAGSGCDFIRTFGISQDLEAAARHLLGDGEYRIDAGLIEGKWGRRHFLNVANTGVVAASVERAERLPRRWGRRRYVPAFWLSLPGFKAGAVTVTTERRTVQVRANNVVIANAQFFGGGLNIAPKATLVDGVFDLQIFTGPKTTALSLLPKIKRGTHLRHPAVQRMRAASVSVSAEADWAIEADGEYVGRLPATFTVVPGALRFKV